MKTFLINFKDIQCSPLFLWCQIRDSIFKGSEILRNFCLFLRDFDFSISLRTRKVGKFESTSTSSVCFNVELYARLFLKISERERRAFILWLFSFISSSLYSFPFSPLHLKRKSIGCLSSLNSLDRVFQFQIGARRGEGKVFSSFFLFCWIYFSFFLLRIQKFSLFHLCEKKRPRVLNNEK